MLLVGYISTFELNDISTFEQLFFFHVLVASRATRWILQRARGVTLLRKYFATSSYDRYIRNIDHTPTPLTPPPPPPYPVFHPRCTQAGIALTASSYIPSEKFMPPPTLRITTNAVHTRGQLEEAVRVLADATAAELAGGDAPPQGADAGLK